MKVFGLTGGIGSGKSSVSAALQRRGAVIVDADAITRSLQEPGQSVFMAMVERFGPDIVRSDGALDRARVADLVFGDPDALADLNAIVHPAVGVEIARRLQDLASTDAIVVLDVPLLVESSRYEVAGLIVVDTPEDIAVDRLVRFRAFRAEDARARMARQASRAERRARADVVIDNSGDLDALETQVEEAWKWMNSTKAPPAAQGMS